LDVVDVDAANGQATVHADLRAAPQLPSAHYHCIVLTQVAGLIDDIDAACAECARILRPGGVLLVTVPCSGRMEPEIGQDADYWRFDRPMFEDLLATAFPSWRTDVHEYGNLAASLAFLYGAAIEELDTRQLDPVDPMYPLTLAARVERPV
jgi:SAM-dependent methyltransferase